MAAVGNSVFAGYPVTHEIVLRGYQMAKRRSMILIMLIITVGIQWIISWFKERSA